MRNESLILTYLDLIPFRSYKKQKLAAESDQIITSTFYCAQLKGEETKPTLNENLAKRRARMTMDRFNCDGWLHVTTDQRDLTCIMIHITHHRCHVPYTDICLTPAIMELVESLKTLSAAKVSDIHWMKTCVTYVPTKDLDTSTAGTS